MNSPSQAPRAPSSTEAGVTPSAATAPVSADSRATEDRLVGLLTGLVQALVDRPEEVRVEAETEDHTTTLRLHVAPEDLGKVVGIKGRTTRSLRSVLAAVGSKTQHRVSLDIMESGLTNGDDSQGSD